MTEEFSEGQTKIIDKIKKLLNHAAGAGTKEEAQTYSERANALLLEYNLSADSIERAGDDNKRVDEKVEGGFHKFHRDIWGAVAKLNFCIYWSQKFKKEETKHAFDAAGKSIGLRTTVANKRRHALVGKTVNVRATIAMAGYLCEAIERVLKEELSGREHSPHLYSNWSNSFRRGASSDIIERLNDRRREAIRKEKRASEHAGKGSESRALSIVSVTQSEEDANNDFLYGEGWSAKRWAALEEAKKENDRRSKAMEDAYTAWAAANPKEARSKFSWTDPKTKEVWSYGSSYRGGGGAGSRGGGKSIDDYGAFNAGYRKGGSISLDQQMGSGEPGKQARIGR